MKLLGRSLGFAIPPIEEHGVVTICGTVTVFVPKLTGDHSLCLFPLLLFLLLLFFLTWLGLSTRPPGSGMLHAIAVSRSVLPLQS